MCLGTYRCFSSSDSTSFLAGLLRFALGSGLLSESLPLLLLDLDLLRFAAFRAGLLLLLLWSLYRGTLSSLQPDDVHPGDMQGCTS